MVSDRISLKPGDPISQSQIGTSQQKLYDLGIFAKVQTAIQNEDSPEDSKYVIFHLDEASKYSFNLGIGAELARIGGGTTTFDDPAGITGFSPRVTVGISRLNFLGLGHTIGAQVRASTLEQRLLVSYVAPQFLGKANTSLSISGLLDNSKDIRTFASRREEGSIQLSQKLSRANTVQVRYTLSPRHYCSGHAGDLARADSACSRNPCESAAYPRLSFRTAGTTLPTSTRGYYNSVDIGIRRKRVRLGNGFHAHADSKLHLSSDRKGSGAGAHAAVRLHPASGRAAGNSTGGAILFRRRFHHARVSR